MSDRIAAALASMLLATQTQGLRVHTQGAHVLEASSNEQVQSFHATLATTDYAIAHMKARRLYLSGHDPWVQLGLKEAAKQNIDGEAALMDAPETNVQVEDDRVCADNVGCEAIDKTNETALIAACQLMEPYPVAAVCPTTCNTPYAQSYCAQTSSPCMDETSHECVHGWRAPPKCMVPFKLFGKEYLSCTTAGSLMKKHWCSHDQDYRLSSSSCDRCNETAVGNEDLWAEVAKPLRCSKVSLVAGTMAGTKYIFENKGAKIDNVFPAASGGKWPAVVAIAGAVSTGLLTWDTLANEVFPWWTKNQSDTRSRVTLRSLLTLTSGFLVPGLTSFTHDIVQQNCLTPGVGYLYTPEKCAMQIYNTANHTGEPGTVFQYNSLHYQLAMAMVVKLSGLDARDYFKKFVFDPAGMTNSYYLGEGNPFVAGGLMTTGIDYARFLHKYVNYEILPREIIDVLETEYKNANNVTEETMVPFPNYAMGNYQSGPCVTHGGTIVTCVNHQKGTFYVLIPSLSQYVGLLSIMLTGDPKHAMVLLTAQSWIEDALEAALDASNIEDAKKNATR